MSTLAPSDLIARSVEVILAGQHDGGGYIASPNFSEYAYAWLRDGSYVALAMDVAGGRSSSSAFHAWVARAIANHADDATAVIEDFAAGRTPSPANLLPTRYTFSAEREALQQGGEVWPNFQLDGYGTWLFALEKHLQGGAVPEGILPSVRLAADYLSACAFMPCYDYWEEFGDRQHTSTLASIAAGLRSAVALTGDARYGERSEEVITYITTACVQDGHFVKGPEDHRVDASLLSLSTPFDLFPATDERVVATVEKIEQDLRSTSGGIRRYAGDTYYGGNPWLLLTAWYGWHQKRAGQMLSYEAARDWVALQAHDDGEMAEQTLHEPQAGAEAYVREWSERWGAVADPLLWSHAKFILMEQADA